MTPTQRDELEAQMLDKAMQLLKSINILRNLDQTWEPFFSLSGALVSTERPHVLLTTSIRIYDVNTKSITRLQSGAQIFGEDLNPPYPSAPIRHYGFYRKAYAQLAGNILHELKEGFLVDGKPFVDPHPPQRNKKK